MRVGASGLLTLLASRDIYATIQLASLEKMIFCLYQVY